MKNPLQKCGLFKPLVFAFCLVVLGAFNVKKAYALDELMTINGLTGNVNAWCSNETMLIQTISRLGGISTERKWKWELLRNGSVVATEELKFKCTTGATCAFFPDWTFNYPISSGEYQIKLKVQKKVLFFFVNEFSASSNKVTVNAGPPAPTFRINNSTASTVNICETDAITLNGAATTCETRYRITIARNGTSTTGTTGWYNRIVPSNINLKSIASSVNVPLVGGGRYTVTLEAGDPSRTFSRQLRLLARRPSPTPRIFIPNFCINETKTLTAPNVPGAGVSWQFPSFLTVVSSPNSLTRVVRANAGGTGNVSVTYSGLCGSNITISDGLAVRTAVPNLTRLSGPTSLCINRDYTFGATATNATGYNWNTTAFIRGGQNSDEITVFADFPGNISVTATNVCGSSPTLTRNFSVRNCGGGGGGGPLVVGPLSTAPFYPNPVKAGQLLYVNLAAQPAIGEALTPVMQSHELTLTQALTNLPVTNWEAKVMGDFLTIDTKGLKPGLYALMGQINGQFINYKIRVD